MRSQHISMTIEEFELMPRKLWWRYEYWDGQAHISPRHHAVTTSFEIRPRPIEIPCKLRAVEQKDKPQLISSYIAAFKVTIEYCDWASEKITTSAREAIQVHKNPFFAAPQKPWLWICRGCEFCWITQKCYPQTPQPLGQR